MVVSWQSKDGWGRLGMDLVRSLLEDLGVLHGRREWIIRYTVASSESSHIWEPSSRPQSFVMRCL